jgi:hypothetical protein
MMHRILSITAAALLAASPLALMAQKAKVDKAWNEDDFVAAIQKGKSIKNFQTADRAKSSAAYVRDNPIVNDNPEVLVYQPVTCSAAMIAESKATGVLYEPAVNYTPYRLWGGPNNKALITRINAFEAAQKAKLNMTWEEKDTLKAALITDVLALAAKKGSVEQSGQRVIPVDIFTKDLSGSFLLEVKDTGSPMIGGRINDGVIFQRTSPCAGVYGKNPDGILKVFGDKGVSNGFTDIKLAIGAHMLLPLQNNEAIMVVQHDGKFWLYRSGKMKLAPTDVAFESQFKGLKLNPGYKLFLVITGTDSDRKFYEIQ